MNDPWSQDYVLNKPILEQQLIYKLVTQKPNNNNNNNKEEEEEEGL